MTPIESARRATWRRLGGLLAGVCLVTVAGCSEATVVPAATGASAADVPATPTAGPDTAGSTAQPGQTGAPAPPPKASGAHAVSKVLGMKDRTLQTGAKVCDVDFVYAGREAEDLFWEEPCAAVTAKMVDRAFLEKLGKWDRLDSFQRKFVAEMPGGKVLYVEGGFSASVYPIDTTGNSIEVAVAD